MQVSVLTNLIGCGLITTAFIIHIVCVSTNYHASADLSNLRDDIKGKNLSPEEVKVMLMISDTHLKINYGLWKLCYSETLDGKPMSDCVSIKNSDKFPIGDWIKGAQAMGILGAILMAVGVIVAVINLAIESRGDRLRLFPFAICGFCILGGIVTFIGDMIMAAKYSSGIKNESNFPKKLNDIILGEIQLSWGFGLDLVCVVLACGGGALHMFARAKAENMVF